MAVPPGTCPDDRYKYYTCAASKYAGCCLVDACHQPDQTCPPASELKTGSAATPTTAPSPDIIHTSITKAESTPTQQSSTASPTQQSPTTSPTQGSAAASPTQSSLPGPSPKSSPLLLITAISIGGVLIIVIIVLAIILYRRRRRRRKINNSAEGFTAHGSVPEPSPDDGPVKGISNPIPNPALPPPPLTKSRACRLHLLLQTHPPNLRRRNHSHAY